MRYRKKPTEIEAVQMVEGAELPQWAIDAYIAAKLRITGAMGLDPGQDERPARLTVLRLDGFSVATLEGTMHAAPGAFLVRGIAGELYPCADAIFRELHEEVE